MEQKIKVTSFKVKYVCDDENCGKDVVFTGVILTCSPPIFVHKCSGCGRTYNLKDNYPYLTTKEVGKWSNI